LVTSDNCRALQSLAREFVDSCLLECCAKLEAAHSTEGLAKRVSTLEDSVRRQWAVCESLERDLPLVFSEFVDAKLSAIAEEIRAMSKVTDQLFRRLSVNAESQGAEMRTLIANLGSELRKEGEEARSRAGEELQAVRGSICELERTVERHYRKVLKPVECPMKEAKSLDGIISRLITKHGGNVAEHGIVEITSASCCGSMGPQHLAARLADLSTPAWFQSGDEPGQWVCWDFRDLRVRPTHYTICTPYLKSWVVESSQDGRSWTEIDRRKGTRDFTGWGRASFAVSESKSVDLRFIRLTQTDTNHKGWNLLVLAAVEFFGTLCE
jgi:hypothetical protein